MFSPSSPALILNPLGESWLKSSYGIRWTWRRLGAFGDVAWIRLCWIVVPEWASPWTPMPVMRVMEGV